MWRARYSLLPHPPLTTTWGKKESPEDEHHTICSKPNYHGHDLIYHESPFDVL